MYYRFDATEDFYKSLEKVKIMLSFAEEQKNQNNEENRSLFLKLAVVYLVTRFQVFIESVLEEYKYNLRNSGKRNDQIPIHLRLNSLKMSSEQLNFPRELSNPTNYNNDKLNAVRGMLEVYKNHCEDTVVISTHIDMRTEFPLGKQGLNELKTLFKQIDGNDVFFGVKFDVNKLNEILHRRHSIIHEDRNQNLTEFSVEKYYQFMAWVVRYLDNYLNRRL